MALDDFLFDKPDEPFPEVPSVPDAFLFGDPSQPAAARLPSALQFDPRYVFWGMADIPVEDALQHLLVLGTTGSGKTVVLRMFLRSMLPRLRAPGANERLVLFDPKPDMLSFLSGMGWHPEDPDLWILNPFDRRSVPWDMAADIRNDADARYLATLLIPAEKNSSSPFWFQAAQDIATAVIIALIEVRQSNWTLRDLLQCLASADRIRAITSQSELATFKAGPYLNDDKHLPAIISTITSKIGQFEIVAALWHNNRNRREPFRVTQFMKRRGIALVGRSVPYHPSLWPINAMLLKVLSDHVLNGPEVRPPQPRHWFVLDEFRWMERVDCVNQLLNQGRSKGVSITLGTQGIEGLISVYGPHGMAEFVGQCTNKVFLRLSKESAEWAVQYFGAKRQVERSMPDSWPKADHGPEPNRFFGSLHVNYQVHDRPVFLASTFDNMATPSDGKFSAITDIPSVGHVGVINKPFSVALRLLGTPGHASDFEPRPQGEDKFPLWSTTEREAFLKDAGTGHNPGPADPPAPAGSGGPQPPTPPAGPSGGTPEDDTRQRKLRNLWRTGRD